MLALLFVTLPFVVRTVQPVLLELDHEMEEAARSLGASELTDFRRIVFRTSSPGSSPASRSRSRAQSARSARSCSSRATCPFKTEVASVFIFSRIQSGDQAGAAAVAVVLLAISFAVAARDRRRPPLRDEARACVGYWLRFVALGYLASSCSARSAMVFWRTFEDGARRRLGRALDAGDGARVQADADHRRRSPCR